MTDPTPDLPASLPSTVPPTAPPPRRLSALVVIVPLLVLAAGAGYYLFEKAQRVEPVDEFAVLKPFFSQLQDEFKPAATLSINPTTLVANAPAAGGRKVETVRFSVVGTTDETKLAAEQAEWKDLMTALGKATGKPVVYNPAGSPDAQMAALKAGTLDVTAFNTGAVPEAVNTAGFVPLVAAADATGATSYMMEILVRPDSPVQKPEDLRGKTVGFVSLSSNSGARAPIYLLKEKFGLLPGRDYTYRLTGSHETSLAELVYGKTTTGAPEYDAVCVASDLHARAVLVGKLRYRGSERDLTAAQTRTIFTSDPFPPLCFGVAHDLPPEVRKAVEKVFADYQFAGSSATAYAKQGKVKFVPIDYAKDWKFVRDIDLALAKLAELP